MAPFDPKQTEIHSLRAENAKLRAELAAAHAALDKVYTELVTAEKRFVEAEKQSDEWQTKYVNLTGVNDGEKKESLSRNTQGRKKLVDHG
jgi:predicted  nucleic acid-binding Zn-ribbon protein